MRPNFWKLSQGAKFFNEKQILDSIEERFVYVHKGTRAIGGSNTSQGEEFIKAPIGDYFYLTHGNIRIYLLGQFTGPANYFSKKAQGWLDRPFRIIQFAETNGPYTSTIKWWTPNDNSTFIQIPENEIQLFEEFILEPYFGIRLINFEL